ncbi:MAG TPA: histidine phosphatase family protein [Dehalococcoidia bacterium]|nr:histidine phosphatase family protein [Dehalococcoidia bacterium]
MSERAEPSGDPIHHFFRDALLIGGDATRVYLVRHAQSEGNTGEDLTTGDPDLTEVGRMQAERLGQRMKEARLDRVYASPLRRTQETAFAIADQVGLHVIAKADLREITLGQAETDIRLLPAEEQAKIARRVIEEGTWDAFPGSEGSAASRARLQGVMDEIIDECPGQRIAVVVHAAFIQTYVSMILGLDRDFVFYPFNCSVHSIRARGDQRVIWRLNDISHLSGMKAGWGGIS